MKIKDGILDGVLVFAPDPHPDERGFFTRTLDLAVALEAGVDASRFTQDSQSRSYCGVIRGLHYRTDEGEAKLVRCSYGRIFDVALDLRPSSPTYGWRQMVHLDDQSHLSLYLPRGIAHGFQALTDIADVCYRIDAAHRPEADGAIAWDDPDLDVPWPLPVTQMSARDRTAPRLAKALPHLHRHLAGQRSDSAGAGSLRGSQ